MMVGEKRKRLKEAEIKGGKLGFLRVRGAIGTFME